jgi:hypothetical protein
MNRRKLLALGARSTVPRAPNSRGLKIRNVDTYDWKPGDRPSPMLEFVGWILPDARTF